MDVSIGFIVETPRVMGEDLQKVDSFNILEVDCRKKGANEFGQVEYGTLLVSGQLLEDIILGTPDCNSVGVKRPLIPYRFGQNFVLSEVSRFRLGTAFLDEPGEPGTRLWCLPILVIPEDPRSLYGAFSGFDDNVKLLSEEGEDNTSAGESRDLGNDLIDEEYESAEDTNSMGSISSGGSEEVIFLDLGATTESRGRRKEDKSDNWLTACCMVLQPTGIKQDEYRRIGVAQIWDLEDFENIPERCLTIV
jgi:hypothetical protein